MPITHFVVRWPDGKQEQCYSPSTIVRQFLSPGDYALEEFLGAAKAALTAASERVRERYGYACSSARDQWVVIEQTADRYRAMPEARVTVVSVD